MRRLRLGILLAGPLLLALLAVAIIGLGTSDAPAPPAAPARRQAPPSVALPVASGSVAPAAPRGTSPGTFEGHVRSTATGAAIPDAELTFSQGSAAASVRAGADGAYVFQPPTAGRWLLAAVSAAGHFPFAPEWGFSPVQLDATPGRRVLGLDVFLAPAVELTGLVVDEDGLPVPGADVRLLGTGGQATLIPIPSRFTTGADGEFRAAAPQGSLLEARKDGYVPGHARVDLQALLDGQVRILLGAAMSGPEPARAALSGRVVGPGGQPVAGALVAAAKTHGWAYGGAPVAQAVTDFDGRFRIGELTRSPHLLTARADGFVPASAGRVLPGGPEVRIELDRGGQLRGCVRDATAGAPVAPYIVRAYFGTNSFRGEPDVQLSAADPSGCFVLAGMPVGQGVLVVLAPGFAPSAPLDFSIPEPPAHGQVEVTVAGGGVVSGVVRDEVTGAALPGAWLSAGAIAAFPDYLQPNTVVSEVTAGPDGAFRLAGLPPRARVIASAAGHHPASTELSVPAGVVFGPVELALRPQQEGDVGPVQPVGIGAVLVPSGEGVAVGAFRPGTPAEVSALAPGDELLEIDGHDVAQLGMAGAVEAMRGPEGTTAYLTVRRGNTTLEVEVPRRRSR